MKEILKDLLLFAAIVAISQLNGCSLMGLGIGSIVDAHKPSHMEVPLSKIETIKPGTKVDILLRDGDTLKVIFAGVTSIPAQEYAETYAKVQEQKLEGTILPDLGDTITVIDTLGKESTYEFLGYAHEWISVRPLGKSESIKVPYPTVAKTTDSRGNVVQGEALDKLISEARIPFLSAIAIEKVLSSTQISRTEAQRIATTQRIPFDKVYRVQRPLKKNAKVTGLIIGAAVDVTVAIVITGLYSLLKALSRF
jgi:hypothetical protein